jgi:small GTP-binding protein
MLKTAGVAIKMGCGRSKAPAPAGGLQVQGTKGKAVSMDAKVVLLGDSGVGKSSIANRYVNNTFSEAFEVTIGGGYLQQLVRLKDGSTLKMEIWDTGGQERFRALLQLYYRGAHAAIITYDVTKDSSLDNCEYWVNELKNNEENCLLFLCGNKADVPATERRVDPKRAEAFAAKHGMVWIETSAKTGHNVNKLFERLGQELVTRREAEE